MIKIKGSQNGLCNLPSTLFISFLISKMGVIGAGPVAKRLSSCTLLWRPRVRRFGSWVQTWHHLLGHVEVVSYIPQLEGSTTKIYTYIVGRFRGKKQKKKKRLATVVRCQSLNKNGDNNSTCLVGLLWRKPYGTVWRMIRTWHLWSYSKWSYDKCCYY